MNNEQKIIDLLSSIAQSVEKIQSEQKDIKDELKILDSKIDSVNSNLTVRMDDMQKYMDVHFGRLDTSIKNINNRQMHLLDMILENQPMA